MGVELPANAGSVTRDAADVIARAARDATEGVVRAATGAVAGTAEGPGASGTPTDEPLVTFVLPCLNEARTLAACIEAAWATASSRRWRAEVVVADNGSTDGSREIARDAGARVVVASTKGYGAALRAGFAAARGRFIVMGDADQSYDFRQSAPMIDRLLGGADLVMGSRMPRSGGSIMPGAMPWKHRYIGNPALSGIGRVLFRAPVTDFHCGLRALSREACARLDLSTDGMELASEMVVRAALLGLRIEEVPITLHKDGRNRRPHLRSWRDGWRHLSFMLCLAPRWTLLAPGVALTAAGLALMLAIGAGPRVVHIGGAIRLDVHTLIAGCLMVLVGTQAMLAALAVRGVALAARIGPPGRTTTLALRLLTPFRAVCAGAGLGAVGLALIAVPTVAWVDASLGDLDASRTLRPMIIGSTLMALGAQVAATGWVLAMLRMARGGASGGR